MSLLAWQGEEEEEVKGKPTYKYARKNAKRRGEKWMDEHFVFKQKIFFFLK